jgi:hypothetical protein
MNRSAPVQATSIDPLAPLLAWLWPGAGHLRLGQKRRGWLIMAGVLFLFITGLLIGGFSVVDRTDQRLWFLAQVLNGPIALAADYINHTQIKSLPQSRQLQTTSLSHVNEMGTLFIALGGLMNLVVILDTLHPRRLANPGEEGFIERRSSEVHSGGGGGGGRKPASS